tara:strand:+ start:872 stop:1354 length:483 start_codon:yes stop_codon:yes gene_type:complete
MKEVFDVRRSADGDDVLKKLNNSFLNTVVLGDESKTLLDTDCGVVVYGADLTSARTLTLPNAEEGLHFKVIFAANWTTDTTLKINAPDGELLKGSVSWFDFGTDDAISDSDIVANLSSNDFLNLEDDVKAGSYIEFYATDSYWVVNGKIYSDVAPAFADS